MSTKEASGSMLSTLKKCVPLGCAVSKRLQLPHPAWQLLGLRQCVVVVHTCCWWSPNDKTLVLNLEVTTTTVVEAKLKI